MMHKLLFGFILVICVTLGILVIYLRIQVASLQCPNNTVVITKKFPESGTERPPDYVTKGGKENTSLPGRNVCSDGWLLLNRICYFFSEERKSQAEGGQSCRFLQAKLATVKATQIILMGYVRSLGREYWVGLKKESRDRYPGDLWYWSDNTIEENIRDENSNVCAKIGQTLSTESCSLKLPWICEKEAEKSEVQ